jgi:BlaI family penicillinase repressor
MQLSKTEEQLMQHLWKLEKAFMKDLLEIYPEPKPATTTVATLLKRMIGKGFVNYKTYGKSRE